MFRSHQGGGSLLSCYSVFKIGDNSIFSDYAVSEAKSVAVNREAVSFLLIVYFLLLMLQSKWHEKSSLMVMSRFFHL